MHNNDDLSKLLSESFDRDLSDSEQRLLDEQLVANESLHNFDSFLGRLRSVTRQLSADGVESTLASSASLSAKARSEITAAIESATSLSETLDHHQADVAAVSVKQENLALATVLIGSGKMSTDQLGEAIEGWSSHGSISLYDHLIIKKAIAPDELDHFDQLAAETLGSDASTIAFNREAVGSDTDLSSVASLLGMKHEDDAMEKAKFKISGEYSVFKKLGGGMGSVWLAHDSALDRTVAIKTIAKSSEPSDAVLARFSREAKITGRLEHPNIVTIYQFGEDEASGNLFYAMEYVGKRTFQDAIVEYHQRKADGTAEKSEFQKLLAAFLTVCQAIGFAHSKGVVHRDLKPQNVALDTFGQITVLDWGLAKVIGDKEIISDTDEIPGGGSPEKTIAGQVLGTPLYMSPEQAAGRIDLIDEWTDVYGLGAILFDLLTGRPPHAGGVDGSGSSNKLGDILTSIVSNDSPKVDPDDDIDPILAGICERAISKRKYSRYSSATELHEAIQNWQCNIASRLRRKEDWRTCVRDAESRLAALCEDATRNLRFLSILPPVQGIMDAIAQRPDAESVDVWRQRLETICEGLLRTNQKVVSISFYQLDQPSTESPDANAIEICAVQRHSNDPTFVSIVPKGRLTWANTATDFPGITMTEPGDSLFSIVDRFRAKKESSKRKYLQAALPTFDHGELFGFVAITCQLLPTLEESYASSVQSDSIHLALVDQDANSIFPSTIGKRPTKLTERLIDGDEKLQQFLGQTEQTTFESEQAFAIRFEESDLNDDPLVLYIIAHGLDAADNG